MALSIALRSLRQEDLEAMLGNLEILSQKKTSEKQFPKE